MTIQYSHIWPDTTSLFSSLNRDAYHESHAILQRERLSPLGISRVSRDAERFVQLDIARSQSDILHPLPKSSRFAADPPSKLRVSHPADAIIPAILATTTVSPANHPRGEQHYLARTASSSSRVVHSCVDSRARNRAAPFDRPLELCSMALIPRDAR